MGRWGITITVTVTIIAATTIIIIIIITGHYFCGNCDTKLCRANEQYCPEELSGKVLLTDGSFEPHGYQNSVCTSEVTYSAKGKKCLQFVISRK